MGVCEAVYLNFSSLEGGFAAIEAHHFYFHDLFAHGLSAHPQFGEQGIKQHRQQYDQYSETEILRTQPDGAEEECGRTEQVDEQQDEVDQVGKQAFVEFGDLEFDVDIERRCDLDERHNSCKIGN